MGLVLLSGMISVVPSTNPRKRGRKGTIRKKIEGLLSYPLPPGRHASREHWIKVKGLSINLSKAGLDDTLLICVIPVIVVLEPAILELACIAIIIQESGNILEAMHHVSGIVKAIDKSFDQIVA